MPWIDVSPALFWDLRNITFSHVTCNSRARRSLVGRKNGPSPLRKIGPKGTAWCDRHNQFLSVALFHRNRAKWNGLQSFCKARARADQQYRRRLPARQASRSGTFTAEGASLEDL